MTVRVWESLFAGIEYQVELTGCRGLSRVQVLAVSEP